jgi:plasmid stabilization system protein ParE
LSVAVAFFDDKDPNVGRLAAKTILAAFRPLTRLPAMGRPVFDEPRLRELIIPFGQTGYMALYNYDLGKDVVRVLAIKHQKEAGYRM